MLKGVMGNVILPNGRNVNVTGLFGVMDFNEPCSIWSVLKLLVYMVENTEHILLSC